MTSMVKLTLLKHGHDYPGANLNARSTAREEGLDALVASIRAEGLLQSLLVCPSPNGDGNGKFAGYYVIAGNRRLAALRRIAKEGGDNDPDVPVIVREDVTPGSALGMSLSENITQVPLHPVDRYETFTALVANGKGEADIAAQYAISKRLVSQSLALGKLHPDIRSAWRAGRIDAGIAEVFTLEPDQKRQAAVFKKHGKNVRFWKDDLRADLIGEDGDAASRYIAFVGVDAYEKAGGHVMIDFFNDRHGVDNPGLAKRLADEKLIAELGSYTHDGWSWAAIAEDLPPAWQWGWPKINVSPKFTAEENKRLKEIDARLKALDEIENGGGPGCSAAERKEEEALGAEQANIQSSARERVFTAEHRAKAGVVLKLDHDGRLETWLGIVKPDDVRRVKDADLDSVSKAKKAKAASGLSNALKDRLKVQQTAALKTALGAGTEPISGALAHLLARIVAAQIEPNRGTMPDAISTAADTLRDAIAPHVMKAALAKHFDPQAYFPAAPKPLVLKAIAEVLGAEQAKKLEPGTKAAAWKFALANVPKTGWLPPELRTAHYDGPASTARASGPAKGKKTATTKKTAKPKARGRG